ncbi:MAG: excinuclease ABC subunit UvrC [Flavobacteriales bacterium]|nr:excinuclease ABC subunit UvrC [Flavobacteriales bacterium]
MNHELKSKIEALPNNPGVYQYYDTEGALIYVGKAKALKKRVSSYFVKGRHDSTKTLFLVRKIADIKYMVVGSETEALLLENSLIKKHQPKYNIQLKDDKTYPWICIKKERFPRIFKTRNVIKDGSEYYGPYASVRMLRAVMDLTVAVSQIRNCNFNLSQENIEKGKFKKCLEFHLGNCQAPCEGLQSEADYNEFVDSVRDVIKGNLPRITNNLKNKMMAHAKGLEFEKAELLKQKIELIEKFQSRSVVVTPSMKNVEVYSIVTDDKSAFINFMKVNNGAIIQGHTIELKKRLQEIDEDLLAFAIMDLRTRFSLTAKEVIVPFKILQFDESVQFIIPKRGDKKALLDLSTKNAKQFRFEKEKQLDKRNPTRRTDRILELIKKDMRLTELPVHIECFDNSNFQGTNAVAACVVFRKAKPAKREYRHFNITTVEGPDDFASMEEVVYRRYKRLQVEKKSLPQLIIIDGGKGQLSSAVTALEKLGLRGQIGIVGIAKKLEEIFFPGDSVPIYIDKRSESLKVIQHLRNEAHRFGITHHRNKRSKGALKTELNDIPGVGEKTVKALLREFKSVKRVREAKIAELTKAVGAARAKQIQAYFMKSN